MEKMAAAIGFFCAILLVLMASVPEASAVVPGARGPRGPVKVDRPVVTAVGCAACGSAADSYPNAFWV